MNTNHAHARHGAREGQGRETQETEAAVDSRVRARVPGGAVRGRADGDEEATAKESSLGYGASPNRSLAYLNF